MKLHTPTPTRTVDTDTKDHWLDRAPERRILRNFWQESVNYPVIWARKFWSFMTTTPGKMTTMVVVLSVLLLGAGANLAQTSDQRRNDLLALIQNTEPVSYLTHQLYNSLSMANTSASVGFVRTTMDSSTSREEYHKAINDATTAMTQAAAGLDANQTRELQLITEISNALPVYTGLIETAWANNRQGNPVGAAYVSQATTMMREEILPIAADLHTLTQDKVEQQQRDLATPQWLPIGGIVLALLGLILGQWWLARTTNRRLNRGMVVATVLVAAIVLWVSVVNWLAWQATSRAYEEASSPVETLSDARIMAQQTRATETLALVRRQSLESSNLTFNITMRQVHDALEQQEAGDAVTRARDALVRWQASHDALGSALDEGDYDRALDITMNTTEKRASAFATLNEQLGILIDSTRETMRTHIFKALRAFDFVVSVVLALSFAAILAIWIGIRPRLQEFL